MNTSAELDAIFHIDRKLLSMIRKRITVGSIIMVFKFLEYDNNKQTPDVNQLLYYGVREDHGRLVKRILKNFKSKMKFQSALNIAVVRNRQNLIKHLIGAGGSAHEKALVKRKNGSQEFVSPIELAIKADDVEMLRLLECAPDFYTPKGEHLLESSIRHPLFLCCQLKADRCKTYLEEQVSERLCQGKVRLDNSGNTRSNGVGISATLEDVVVQDVLKEGQFTSSQLKSLLRDMTRKLQQANIPRELWRLPEKLIERLLERPGSVDQTEDLLDDLGHLDPDPSSARHTACSINNIIMLLTAAGCRFTQSHKLTELRQLSSKLTSKCEAVDKYLAFLESYEISDMRKQLVSEQVEDKELIEQLTISSWSLQALGRAKILQSIAGSNFRKQLNNLSYSNILPRQVVESLNPFMTD